MQNIAIIQARLSSTRLPRKLMLPLQEKPVIKWVFDSARQIVGIDQVILATSLESSDDDLEKFCHDNDIECFRGDLANVLKRFYDVAKKHDAKFIMRITGDCPLLDPDICSGVLYMLKDGCYDYVSNSLNPTFPDGLDCEAFTMQALEKIYKQAKDSIYTEHVTAYVNYNRNLFNIGHYNAPLKDLQKHRWTLDTIEDYDFIKKIVKHIPKNKVPRHCQILNILQTHSEFNKDNQNNLTQARNAGLEKNIRAQKLEVTTKLFKKSKELLARAEAVIPLGTQTFSKSKISYMPGHAPLFATHGLGGRIWDVDGNMYVGLGNGLVPNILGYADPDVNNAIKQQLNNGITLSLATELEFKLAEKLVEIIPCAEKVRFAKNGTDATSACVRLARAYTGKDKIIVCGYHGWQDWYISTTTKNKGIPKSVMELSYTVPYNDLMAVENLLNKYKGEFAGMIIEPMNYSEPNTNYLKDLKSLLHKHNALLIFDEVITGFRFSLGGAQELFNVTPDLASFGKSMGNGMPMSAVVGSNEVMKEMEEIFFSGTFGGETLSIAASIAVIDKMQREPVIEKLWDIGRFLKNETQKIIDKYELTKIVELSGNDSWAIFSFKDYKDSSSYAIKTYLLHEMYKQGILILGAHNVCYAHNDDDISYILNAYEYSLKKVSSNLKKGNIEKNMDIPVIKPLFSVRKI